MKDEVAYSSIIEVTKRTFATAKNLEPGTKYAVVVEAIKGNNKEESEVLEFTTGSSFRCALQP